MAYQKDDRITVTIQDIGTDGEGIGKADGFTVFIKDAIPGDVVSAKFMKVKKQYGYAKLEKVLAPSPFRVTSKCSFARQCGGCQLQNLSYEEQLKWKQIKVTSNLERIGGFDSSFLSEVTEPIIGMEEPFRYRNKAQFPIGVDREGKPISGFYAGHSHNIIANTDCPLGVMENKEILEKILFYMKKNYVKAYDETTGKGLIRHVLIRKGFTTGQIMVCVVINGESLPKEEELISLLRKTEGVASISVSINTENTNVIMGLKIRILFGEGYIEDKLGETMFRISPLSFYQVNPVQTKKLYSLAVEFAGLSGNETVWDLYCGIGTISLFLAPYAAKVLGVEIIPEAINDAKENAKLNHITNADFFVGKAEEVLPAYYESETAAGRSAHADVIVVDPPRKGCDEICLQTMLKMNPDKIVYVSCDSATLARDLKVLCESGYELKKVRAVDQFPQTVHVETVVLMSRK